LPFVMDFAAGFIPAPAREKLVAAGYTSKESLCVPVTEREAFLQHLVVKAGFPYCDVSLVCASG
jgi:hypothetical protein